MANAPFGHGKRSGLGQRRPHSEGTSGMLGACRNLAKSAHLLERLAGPEHTRT